MSDGISSLAFQTEVSFIRSATGHALDSVAPAEELDVLPVAVAAESESKKPSQAEKDAEKMHRMAIRTRPPHASK